MFMQMFDYVYVSPGRQVSFILRKKTIKFYTITTILCAFQTNHYTMQASSDIKKKTQMNENVHKTKTDKIF